MIHAVNLRTVKTARAAGTLLIAIALIAGCRVGGPTTDAEGFDDDGGRSGIDGSVNDGSTADGGGPKPGVDSGGGNTDSGKPPVGSDGSAGDAQTGPDGGVIDASHPDTSTNQGDGGCSPTGPVTTCDPVCNTGCPGLSRCDLTDKAGEGTCIGIWIQGEDSFCIKTPTTDPCAPQLACVDSACVKLCYHDSDCAGSAKACCREAIVLGGQASTFKKCGACSP
jgi:hypothetical protein